MRDDTEISSHCVEFACETFHHDVRVRHGRPQIAVTNPENETTTMVYDDVGPTTATIDPLGHATSYTYDLADRQLTVKDPLLHVTTVSVRRRALSIR